MSTRCTLIHPGRQSVEPTTHVWWDVGDDRVRIQCEAKSLLVETREDMNGGTHVVVRVELPDELSAVLLERLRGSRP